MKFQCGKCNHMMDVVTNYCTACGVQLNDGSVADVARSHGTSLSDAQDLPGAGLVDGWKKPSPVGAKASKVLYSTYENTVPLGTVASQVADVAQEVAEWLAIHSEGQGFSARAFFDMVQAEIAKRK